MFKDLLIRSGGMRERLRQRGTGSCVLEMRERESLPLCPNSFLP